MPSPSSSLAHRRRKNLLGVALAVLAAASGACALSGCRDAESAASEAREWRWLVAAKRALDAERDGLADLPAGPERERREKDAARRVAGYQARLGRYLERHRPEAGQPLAPRERAALHMRSDESARVAHEFLSRAGDHRQAIEICRSALALDPGYPPLERELAAAEAGRYVTAEQLGKVKPGMAPAAVRDLLGPPNLHDVRDYPQRGLVAWFYAKDASGAAAAVWFRKEAGGPGQVFQVDFDAVDPRRDASQPPAPPASPTSG